jgi:hypothetical protein
MRPVDREAWLRLAADWAKLAAGAELNNSRRGELASFRNLLDRCTAKHSIILEVLLDETVVGGPTHLRGFGRNPPIIQIRRTEFRLQLGPTDVGPVDLTAELRTVGNLSAPILTTAEKPCSGRSPEN